MKRILTFSVLILLAGQLNAAEKTGLYIGIGSGFMRMETDLASNALLPDYGDPIESENFNKTSLGLKLIAGYRILEFVGIEAGYFKIFDNNEIQCFTIEDPDNPGSRICGDQNTPGDFRDETWKVEIPLDGYTVSVAGFFPLNDTFELVGKIGGVYTEIDGSAREPILGSRIPFDSGSFPRSPNPPVSSQIKSSGWDEVIAVGLNFNAPESNFSIRAELEWFNITELDEPWMASLNALFSF